MWQKRDYNCCYRLILSFILSTCQQNVSIYIQTCVEHNYQVEKFFQELILLFIRYNNKIGSVVLTKWPGLLERVGSVLGKYV